MASAVTYMQRITKFCDLTNTINTINCGKRVGSFNVSRNVPHNSCSKPAANDNNPMTKSNLKPINEYSSDVKKNLDGNTINIKLGERNIDPNGSIGFPKETEDSGSEWEYYSDDENADEKKDLVSLFYCGGLMALHRPWLRISCNVCGRCQASWSASSTLCSPMEHPDNRTVPSTHPPRRRYSCFPFRL